MKQEEIFKLLSKIGEDKQIMISTQALAMISILSDDKIKDCLEWYFDNRLCITGSTILEYAGYLESIKKEYYKQQVINNG